MAQPRAYNRTKDFTQDFGNETDHSSLNAELDAAGNSINDIRANMAILQADDGKLRPNVVTVDSIDNSVRDDLSAGIVLQVQGSVDAAATSATAAANSATAALASKTAAASSETSAAGSATAAAASASSASASAATATSEASEATDAATSAAGSASTASTAATNAAASASSASTSATSASSAATTATTKAGEASTSATNAAASASSASTSAGNAASSATAAATSATAAANSAAAINVPQTLTGKTLNLLRVKADESGYEHRTASQVRSDIGAAASTEITFHGQCRLTKSGSNLLLSRFNGNKLAINGVIEAIPSAGVTLAPTGLVVSTLYYIYAYMNAGVMTLEALTTTHATDATTGVEIKSGDATRTLVGMARPTTGPAWTYSATDKSVRSWFNDRGIAAGGVSANQATTSATLTNVASVPVNALMWSGEQVVVNGSGTILAGGASAGATLATLPAINGATVGGGSTATAANGAYSPYAYTYYQDVAADGYFTYQTFASTSIANASTWAAIFTSIASRRTNG